MSDVSNRSLIHQFEVVATLARILWLTHAGGCRGHQFFKTPMLWHVWWWLHEYTAHGTVTWRGWSPVVLYPKHQLHLSAVQMQNADVSKADQNIVSQSFVQAHILSPSCNPTLPIYHTN